MTSQQATEWKQDRQRRVVEMKARLLSAPEPTADERRKVAAFDLMVARKVARAKRYGWGEGS